MNTKTIKKWLASVLAITTAASMLPVHAVYEPTATGSLGGIMTQVGTLSKASTASVS